MRTQTQNRTADHRRVPPWSLAMTLALAVMLLAVQPAQAQYYGDGLPGGNWRNYCTNARMAGNELKAHCRNRNGILVFVEANVSSCGGNVSYDVSQTKFFCGYQGGSGLGSGSLPAGNWRQYCTNARMDGNELKAHCPNRNGTMVFVEANISSCGGVVAYDINQTRFICGYQSNGYGGGLPGGQWRQYCTNAYLDGNELKATCRRPDGSYRHTEANISECGGRDIDYIISTGRFQCAGFGGPGYGPGYGSGGNAGFPPGTWSQSCTNASMQGSLLTAQCRNNFGQMVYSQIDANQCYNRGVWNNNGVLRCQ